MGRESNNDSVVIQSSIALLQERFRQLQRVKEMREERELHKMVAEPNKQALDMQMQLLYDDYFYEPSSSRLFFHFLPTKTSSPTSLLSSPQVSLSLWSSNSQSKHEQLLHLHDDDDHYFNRCMETPQFMSLRLTSSSETPSAKKFKSTANYHDDVDTSLHL